MGGRNETEPAQLIMLHGLVGRVVGRAKLAGGGVTSNSINQLNCSRFVCCIILYPLVSVHVPPSVR